MNLVKQFRKKAKASQCDLAAASGVSQFCIYSAEGGARDSLRLDSARAIVAGLNKLGVECSFSDVFPDDVDS